MKFNNRTAIYQVVILLFVVFSIAGCGSTPAMSQPSQGPFGLVYFRANQPVDSNVGAYYYYDFSTKQTRRLTDNNIDSLTLRGQLSGAEFPQGGIGRLDGAQIKFRLERKVIEFGVAFEQFEFDVPAQRGKEVIRLGHYRVGR